MIRCEDPAGAQGKLVYDSLTPPSRQDYVVSMKCNIAVLCEGNDALFWFPPIPLL